MDNGGTGDEQISFFRSAVFLKHSVHYNDDNAVCCQDQKRGKTKTDDSCGDVFGKHFFLQADDLNGNFLSDQEAESKSTGCKLCNYRSPGSSCDSHAQQENKNRIQYNIGQGTNKDCEHSHCGKSLTGDEIEEIAGILNGTTNYMMTRMFYEGANYEEVLREAQKNGFAEADPTADVEGQDACRKIAILASIISGKYVDFEEIYTEGITKITTEDMQYAKALGMNIKLLAECKHVDGTLYAGVAPVLLHAEHPLYSVNGVFNAVFVKGNMLGDAMFYGSGAGKLPTASAVVADIVAVVQNQGRDIMNFWSEEKLTLEDRSKTSKKFLVRIRGNVDAFKERIGNDFGEVRFVEAGVNGEFGFVTPVMTEGEYEEKAKAYPEILHMIRVEEEV